MKKKKFDLIANILLIAVSLFFVFEALLPSKSPINVLEKIDQSEIELTERTKPTEILFNKDSVNLSEGSMTVVHLEFKGDENVNKGILVQVVDESICSYSMTSIDRIYITGIKVGSTKINISSIADASVHNTLNVTVASGSTVGPLNNSVVGISVDGRFTTSKTIRAKASSQVKIIYAPRDKNNTILPAKIEYFASEGLSIDSNGNLTFTKDNLLKTYTITASCEYGVETYNVTVAYPYNFAAKFASHYVYLFVAYIVTFAMIGSSMDVLLNWFKKKYPKQRILRKMLICFIIALPFIILLLQAFVLSRPFEYIYWIVSPIVYYLLFGFSDTIGKKLLRKVLSDNNPTTLIKEKKDLIIMMGSSYLDIDEDRLLNKYFKNVNSVSSATYEKKLVDAFLSKKDIDFIYVSAPHVGWWPLYSKKILIYGFHETDKVKTVSYLTPIGLLQFFKGIALKHKVEAIIDEKHNEYNRIHIVACEAHKPYLKVIKFVKKTYKNSYSTLVVPDLPDDIITSKSKVYRFFKKKNVESVYKICKNDIDSFVCFTKEINTKINPSKKPYKVIPGATSLHQNIYKAINKEIHCVYIGKLDYRNGMKNLVQLSKIVPENIIIDVYGNGESFEYLKQNESNNLKIHGFLAPRKVDAVIKNADVMLSLRSNKGHYIKYSFPSKIFDYLSYFKPIVTYKIDCYFPELDDVLTYPTSDDNKDVLAAIQKALKHDNPKRHEKINAILSRFDSTTVIEEILDFSNN